MTLFKVAKKETPAHTYYAYKNEKGNYYWRNPFNEQLLPLKKKDLNTWVILRSCN